MPRSTLVFGNGLGRTLDNDFFQLQTGLREVWNNNENFSHEQRRLVASALPNTDEERFPSHEDQLDQLQVALVSASFLRSFETEEIRWLADASRELPNAFRRFVHEVAAYFHTSGMQLPPDFRRALAEGIRKTKSHVATLNYDNLLYDALKDEGVLRGYYDTLIDGFTRNAGFSPVNLDRNDPDTKSWYLHLHGSPLYVGNKKLMGVERAELKPSESSHIVLAHVTHKPLVISNSHILSEYWGRLAIALEESERVVLVGYSGGDKHLNKIINDRFRNRDIVIVERRNNETQQSRNRFWSARFPSANLTIHRPESILQFTDWFQ